MRFLAGEVSTDTYINLMAQYRPCYKAEQLPELNRPPTGDELDAARRSAQEVGLHRFDQRRSFPLAWILRQ
jgi:putative pyruvate formate lyase activating enzyme